MIEGNQQFMDQTNVTVGRLEQLSNDITAVYELIIDYRSGSDTRLDKSEKTRFQSIVSLLTWGVVIIIFGLLASVYILPPTVWGDSTEEIRRALQIMVLVTYALGGGLMILQYFSVRDLFRDFAGQIIGIAANNAKDEAALFLKLDQLSRPPIKYVAHQFEHITMQLGQIRSFLLGAIEKVGIIPGLIATVLAISKVAESTGVSWLEVLSVVMLGVYLSMFPIAVAAFKIKRTSVLLNQYLSLVEQNPGPTEESIVVGDKSTQPSSPA